MPQPMIAFGDLEIDPVALGSQGNAVLGIRDSGKTYTATYLAEGLFKAGVPFIAFDPIGVWRFLRVPGAGAGYPIVVAGGADGDLPLTPAGVPALVEAAMKNGVSLVLDLFDINLSKSDWRKIVMAALRTLLHQNQQYGLRHVFIEEAAEFAPQKVTDGHVYAEMEKLARMGGNARLGYTLINQRSEEVNKALLELCDNLFLHRQKGRNSLTALSKWLDIGNVAGHKEIIGTLSTLPTGECWAWLAGSDTPVHVKVPAKTSLHPDRRVMRGDAEISAAKPVDVGKFVESMRSALGAAVATAKANDPSALKAELARLTRELAKAPKVGAADPTAAREAENAAYIRGKADGYAEGMKDGGAAVAPLLAALGPLEAAIAALKGEAPKIEAWTARPPKGQRAAPSPKPAPVVADGSVPAGCAKPLAALAGVFPAGMTEPQWATAAGYKRSGGTWGTYKSRLRGAGLIEAKDGRWFATEAGARAVGDVEMPPAPGPDLVRWWAAKLPGTSRMAEVLIEAGPQGLDRETLAQRLDMSAAGGSFGTYLSRLASPGLIERSGGIIRLSPEVMP